MDGRYLTEMARQWVSEQGEDAGEHLADAIRELRAVGDTKGAALLAKIAQRIEQIDDAIPHGGGRTPIRRPRNRAFGPSA